MAPRVSIVLPNYNYASYLDERITSLLGQTWDDFELIILDDGSTDGSRDVVARYVSDPRVRTVCFDENSGHPYKRWNDGAALATGEYLLFAGADDTCDPALLATLVARLDALPACVVAHARSRVIDATGQPVRLRPADERWNRDFVATGAEEAPYLLLQNTIPNASGALMRRAAFDACRGFDTKLRLSADHLLWARMLRHASLAYVAAPLNSWRTHDRTVRRSLGTDHFVREWYQVIRFITESYDIPADARERALRRAFDEWMKVAGSRPMPFDVVRHTWAAAREADPGLLSRVAHVAPRRLLSVARSVWNATRARGRAAA